MQLMLQSQQEKDKETMNKIIFNAISQIGSYAFYGNINEQGLVDYESYNEENKSTLTGTLDINHSKVFERLLTNAVNCFINNVGKEFVGEDSGQPFYTLIYAKNELLWEFDYGFGEVLDAVNDLHEAIVMCDPYASKIFAYKTPK